MPTIADAARINSIPIGMLVETLTKQYPDRKWEKTAELPADFNLSSLQKPAQEQVQHLQVEGKLTKQEATKILKAESLANAIVSAVREVELAVAYSEGQVTALEQIDARNQGETSILKAWQEGRLTEAKLRFDSVQSRMQALTGSAQQVLADKVQSGEAGKDLLAQIREFTI